MNWYSAAGMACICALFLPVTIIIYYKLYRHRSLAALMVYYLLTALHNLMAQGYIPASENFTRTFGVVTNYLDVPLMLTGLLFFCPIKKNQKVVSTITIAFVSYELLVAVFLGLTPLSVVYIMGPGLVLVLVYSFILFLRQIKFTIMHNKNTGRAIMLASILFAYACYLFVYYFFYIQRTPYINDAYLLYFITCFVAAILMAVGLIMTRKRLKEYQDLQNTRKELALFFNS
jgi:hypothetical protein